MPITQAGDRRSDNDLLQNITDIAAKVFPIAAIAVALLYGYIFYGMFSGQLAGTAVHTKAEALHAVQLIGQLSMWLNVALVVMLLSSLMLHYEEASVGYVYLIAAAALAYGFKFLIEFLYASDAAKFAKSGAGKATSQELQLTAIFFAVAGVLLVVRQMFVRVTEARQGTDLTNVSYGKDAKTEDVPKAIIGAAAKCWQLPFCREGVRKSCPIYHARTKCWKQRVGCMCEENVIRLAAIGGSGAPEATKPLDAVGEPTKGQGFIPIGDLIVENERKKTDILPTRIGPRGVRIPTNPHLTEGQKKMRCHNCIIYNEHQRQKYQLFSPIVTLLVPLFVVWKFDDIRAFIGVAMGRLDGLLGHLSFSGQSGASDLSRNVTGSLPVEVVLVICLTLVMMTWTLRFLEYCMFKIKI